jgi:nitrogen regulatory protein PII
MKMITAYVRYASFEYIRAELLELGFPSLSVTEVKGSGRQKGITEQYRGSKVTNYLRPKLKLDIGVASADVQTVLDTILKHAQSGDVGDGKIFVTNIEQVYRIRTGETGEITLQLHPGSGDVPAS